MTEGWLPLWSNYYKPAHSKLQILHAIEEHIVSNENWLKFAPNYVLYLYYDLDILPGDVIIEWYENLVDSHPLQNNKFKELIDWIIDQEKTADEEENESDE